MSRENEQKKLLPSEQNTPLEERVEILYKMIDGVVANKPFVGIVDSFFPCNQKISDHFTASNSCFSSRRSD